MANPKKRTSPRKRNMRRANIRLSSPNTIICSQCQEPTLRHIVCPHCGYYKGRQVIKTGDWD